MNRAGVYRVKASAKVLRGLPANGVDDLVIVRSNWDKDGVALTTIDRLNHGEEPFAMADKNGRLFRYGVPIGKMTDLTIGEQIATSERDADG